MVKKKNKPATISHGRVQNNWQAKYFLACKNPDFSWSNNEYYNIYIFAYGISHYAGDRPL